MNDDSPGITLEALARRVQSEAARLDCDDLAWWETHRVEPFVLPRHGLYPYAVAVSGEVTLVFFDDRDSFGHYSLRPRSEGLRLFDDLAHAVRCLATRDLLSRVLSETASRLIRHEILERGDALTRERVLNVLGGFGPDAAVAVPKLIEIMSREGPCGGLQESAVAALSKIGPAASPAVPKLIEMAERDTANARAWCLMAFASIGPAAAPAVPMLIDVLLRKVSHDPPSYVSMAADALGDIGAIEALPALLRVLQETDDPELAHDVIEAIGKLGPEAAEAEPPLVALAHDRPGANRFPDGVDFRDGVVFQPVTLYGMADVSKAAREALKRIGKPVPPDLGTP